MKSLLLLLILIIRVWNASSSCDCTHYYESYEGNIGQSVNFPWLGVLRVELPDLYKVRIAVTGVILIHEKYVIAHANDVAKIPADVLRDHSTIMFIEAQDVPWFCYFKRYITHPEYDYTLNTIALIQLNLDNIEYYPIRPICLFKKQSTIKSENLFAIGFTEEYSVLEKVIFKMRPHERKDCDKFYKRAGLTDASYTPTKYDCAVVTSARSQCVWDNGMMLVSNATKCFVLLGFGVQGPGCAAPTRFISLHHYYDWMNDTISSEIIKHETLVARAEPQVMALHEMFPMDDEIILRRRMPSHFDSGRLGPIGLKHFFVDEINDGTIVLYPIDSNLERNQKVCGSGIGSLHGEVYGMDAVNHEYKGISDYTFDLNDLKWADCISIKISVVSDYSPTRIAYKEVIKETNDDLESEEEYDKFFGRFREKESSYIDCTMYVRIEYTIKATITIQMLGPIYTSKTTTETPAVKILPKLTSKEERLNAQNRARGRTPKPWNRKSFQHNWQNTNGFIANVPDFIKHGGVRKVTKKYPIRMNKLIVNTLPPKHLPNPKGMRNFPSHLISNNVSDKEGKNDLKVTLKVPNPERYTSNLTASSAESNIRLIHKLQYVIILFSFYLIRLYL